MTTDSDSSTPTSPRSHTGRARRGWLASAAHRALGGLGAKLGSGWVLILAALAVFAPFIANSKPYLLVKDGEWSSPLINHLTAADVVLLTAFVSWVVLLLIRRLSWARRCLIFAGILFISIGVCGATVKPPSPVVPEKERQMLAAGEASYALWAPIPYSPGDHQFDNDALRPPSAPLAIEEKQSEAYVAAPHWLGTDRYGRDVLSRLIHASRVALAVGFIAESISLVLGVIIGAIMGYFAGLVDLLGLRLVEVFTAIPRLFLLLAVVAAFERNIFLIMTIVGATGWPAYAYFVRAEFLRLRNQDFVQAAIAADTPLHSILFRHMLPNGMAPVLVQVGFGVAEAILYESVLSFLGLGVVDQASWGELLDQAVSKGGGFYWWIASFPGLAIFFTVFAFNLVGESMRDAIDPHTGEGH